MTLREAIRAATARLTGISDTPRLDAELLAAHATGIEREALLLGKLDEEAPAAFEALVVRRERGEPIAYITGHRDFWTIRLKVAPEVLIPRPDSETLIEAAVRHFEGNAGPATVLDLGTGSGALLLAALDQWPEAKGVGIDRSEAALAIARENAERLGHEVRALVVQGDWDAGLAGQRFDLILCNPPYIGEGEILPDSVVGFEPLTALFSGADGLDDYRRLAPRVAGLLAPGGIALFEIGASQGQAVADLFRAQGHAPELLPDLAGRDRCVAIRG